MWKLKAKECTWLVSEVTCRMSSPISFYLSLIFHPILFPRSEVPCMELAGIQGQSLITRVTLRSEERGRKWVRFGYFPWLSPILIHIRWLHSLQPTTHPQSGWLTLYFFFEESWNCICHRQWYWVLLIPGLDFYTALLWKVFTKISYLRVLAVMILHAKILDSKYTIFLKNSSKFTHVPT